MRVEIIHTGGRYAERVCEHLAAAAPGSVTWFQVPSALPMVLDEPEEFLPAKLGESEIIIAINIHPDLLLEVPHRVGPSVRALIGPIEDPGWIKPGLQRQVTQACAQRGIETAFPKPFCSLDPSTPAIAEFSEQYKVGVPTFRIKVEDGRVAAVDVVRGAPCGLTDFVARSLIGEPADDALAEKAGQFHHTYPCLATMNLDPATGETVMHASLYLIRDRVAEALREARGE